MLNLTTATRDILRIIVSLSSNIVILQSVRIFYLNNQLIISLKKTITFMQAYVFLASIYFEDYSGLTCHDGLCKFDDRYYWDCSKL
jgi:hypothetical protein